MGLIQLEMKNFDKAKILFEECIHINPSFNLSYVGLGNVYYELDQYQLAETYHHKAYNMEKKDLHVVISYANTLMSEEVK
jgi:Tfp pilus assembly protein PilF